MKHLITMQSSKNILPVWRHLKKKCIEVAYIRQKCHLSMSIISNIPINEQRINALFPRLFRIICRREITFTNSKEKNHQFNSQVRTNGIRYLSEIKNEDFECPLNNAEYELVSEETLQSLADCFDEIISSDWSSEDTDVTYNSGVLTVHLGANIGTYVINKQTPNKQIWLSSPLSGPKRYDYVNGKWIYKHDGVKLHDLLNGEISKLFKKCKIDFTKCSYG